MTLEEIIKHCEKVAEEQEMKARMFKSLKDYERSSSMQHTTKECEKCASEHRQLAEWLRELQIYRKKLTEIELAVDFYKDCETCQGFREYPTDEFVEDLVRILEVNTDEVSD